MAIKKNRSNYYDEEKDELLFSLENIKQLLDFPKNIFDDDNSERDDEEKITNSLYLNKLIKKEEHSFQEIKNNSLDSNINKFLEHKSKGKIEIGKEKVQNNYMFFKILCHKRGRKPKKIRYINHGANYLDIIERKIQVNFLTFLVNLANDAIRVVFGKRTEFNFKHINYNEKRKMEYNYFEEIKKHSYSDILKMKVSKKYRIFTEEHNQKILVLLCEKSEILKRFFSQNYLTLFKAYYFNDQKPLDHIIFNEIKITFSPKTKCFYYLLQKEKNIKNELINVVNLVYFNGEINQNKRHFETIKNE